MSFVVDIGLRFLGEEFNLYEWERTNLTYARVGNLEFGTERFPVATEDGVLENGALALSVYPNPSRGATTVRFSLDVPQRVTLAVFDVLGRRVLVEDLGAQPTGEADHRLEVAGVPTGFYVVRLTGDAGARATAQIVRH